MNAHGRTNPILIPGVLLFSLVLIQLPLLLREQPPLAVYPLMLIPFVLAICALLMQPARWFVSTAVILAVGYVILIVVGAFRAGLVGVLKPNAAILEALQITLLATLGALAFLREPREEQRHLHLQALCWAPAMFMAVNVALYVAGIVPAGQYTVGSSEPARC